MDSGFGALLGALRRVGGELGSVRRRNHRALALIGTVEASNSGTTHCTWQSGEVSGRQDSEVPEL